MIFESEEKYEDYLENSFKNDGWEVARQQPSDETKHWDCSYTLDLIIRKKSVLNNQWIGLELKNFEGVSKGGEFWKVIKQIKKYSYLHFRGEKIKYWCIGIPEDNLKYNHCDDNGNVFILKFVKTFVNSLGIGFLQNDVLKFCDNNGKGMIDIGERSFPHETDYDYIDNIVSKLKKWDIDFIIPKIDGYENEVRCDGCGGVLDIEEIKFNNICIYCSKTISSELKRKQDKNE